jgi:hypothetical protein
MHVPRRLASNPLALSCLLAVLLPGTAAAEVGKPGAPRNFYIDFDSGDDRASGLSPDAAWKRAPGDTRAEAVARTTRLQPGDRLLFRGGVAYRGTIMARTAGTAVAPIRYLGTGWGEGAAILDGSDTLPPARPCRSAADCLGAPNWHRLQRVKLPEGARWSDGLFGRAGAYRPAAWPGPDQLATLPEEALPLLRAGRIETALPAPLRAGEPVLALRVRPGVLGYSPPVRVTSTGVEFAREGWLRWGFAPEPGANLFALVNTPAAVDRPGLFAMSTRRRIAVVWLLPGDLTLSHGSGRQGVHLLAGGHVEVSGFAFRNFGGGDPSVRLAAIPLVQRWPLPGVRLAGNSFGPVAAGSAGLSMQLPAAPSPADARPLLACAAC